MDDNIELVGITPFDLFPKCPPHFPFNQICETDRLCVPDYKPPVENILQVCVNLSLECCEVICTPVGDKLVIEGSKHIKIMYVADEPSQSVHSAHFDVPFCMFVLLKKLPYKVVDVITVIEDIRVKQTSCRCFYISVIIFACPEIEEIKGCCEYVDFYRDCKDEFDCKDYENNNEELELFLDEDEKDHSDLADYSEVFYSKTNFNEEVPQKVNRTKKNLPHRKYSLKRKKVKYYKSR